MRVLESGSVSEIQLEEKSVFRLKKLRTLQIRRRTKSNISQSSIANAVWRSLADDFHSLWKVRNHHVLNTTRTTCSCTQSLLGPEWIHSLNSSVWIGCTRHFICNMTRSMSARSITDSMGARA
eukprot:2554734-Pleurochrysis_carterae.AAC.2